MFKMKSIITIAIVCSGLATFGMYRYIQGQNNKTKGPEEKNQEVVTAKIFLPVGKKIESSDVQLHEWPQHIVPSGSFGDPSEVIGRVVRADAYAGEAILEDKLAPKGSEGGFSSVIPPGMRALTVSVNNYSGVGGFVLPSTRVDVLVTVPSPSRKGDSITKIILEDIKVLAVDQIYEREKDDPVKVQTVTLLVNPKQAEQLVLASTEGKLQLSLRNTADRSTKMASGIKLKELIARRRAYSRRPSSASSSSANSSKKNAEKTKQVIEVIQSNQRAEVVFENGERKSSKQLVR